MPDPELRKLLEYARPVRDFAQLLQTSFRMVEAAVAAEGTLANAMARAEAAAVEAQRLEARKSTLADEVASERERLLTPTFEELARVQADAKTFRDKAEAERQAFDDERGRRTSILRTLDEQAADAKRRNAEETQALGKATDGERRRLQQEIETLRAQAALAAEDLNRLRGEYRAVQEAAAKLSGR